MFTKSNSIIKTENVRDGVHQVLFVHNELLSQEHFETVKSDHLLLLHKYIFQKFSFTGKRTAHDFMAELNNDWIFIFGCIISLGVL